MYNRSLKSKLHRLKRLFGLQNVFQAPIKIRVYLCQLLQAVQFFIIGLDQFLINNPRKFNVK